MNNISDFNISDSMAESIFNNEIIQNMTDEAFDNILDTIGFSVPDIIRDIPIFKYTVSIYSLANDIIKRVELKKQFTYAILRSFNSFWELSKGNINQKELNERRIAYVNKKK